MINNRKHIALTTTSHPYFQSNMLLVHTDQWIRNNNDFSLGSHSYLFPTIRIAIENSMICLFKFQSNLDIHRIWMKTFHELRIQLKNSKL